MKENQLKAKKLKKKKHKMMAFQIQDEKKLILGKKPKKENLK